LNKAFYILLSFLFHFACSGQVNLVQNPSFEDAVYCPVGADIYSCAGWNTPNEATPDYFNPCANGINYGTPSNGFGYETAHSGNSYAGFVPYAGGVAVGGKSYREYIQSKLLNSMEANSLYEVSFYLSCGDSGICSSNNIGVFFSNTSFYYNDSWNLPFEPSCNETYIVDKVSGWQLVEFYYWATGNENYLTIGNFYNDALTSTQSIVNNHNDSYYFIDDVSVTKQENNSNVFTPNNDGVNDLFLFKGLDENDRGAIYNRWGLKIYEFSGINSVWDGRISSGEICSNGVYYYLIERKKEKLTSGFIQLIR
jgi:gliding motility-associated-like protein